MKRHSSQYRSTLVSWRTVSAVQVLAAVAMLGAVVSAGCMDRPVAPQQPSTSRIGTQIYRASRINKIDLLFMIDNSMSMADKQEILAAAVPDLVKRFTQPRCLDADGNVVAGNADGTCRAGSSREFDPIEDIHVGVITSSLGGRGADQCEESAGHKKDMAHLVTRASAGGSVKTYEDKGFIFWDPSQKGKPPGERSATALIEDFTEIVRGAGQDGCGYEASLEAWYRFLVDPAPYLQMVPVSCDPANNPADRSCRAPQGVDEPLLLQRSNFLRQDSLVAIIMLSDENDCSLVDSGKAYQMLQSKGLNPGEASWHMPRATSACNTDPMSPACMSCASPGAPSDDPQCAKGDYPPEHNDANLRCFHQKQRFGIDALWPVKRYVNGLTRKTFTRDDIDRGLNSGFRPGVDINPLYCTTYEQKDDPANPGAKVADPSVCKGLLRDPSLVFLGGIVGVPWQDIAVDPRDMTKGYRPVEEFGWSQADFDRYNESNSDEPRSVPAGVDVQTTVWNQILGKVDSEMNIDPRVDPKDPLMIESIEPRSGTNPATGEALAGIDATSPTANSINGRERNIAGADPSRARDLQYACTFKLPPGKERVCDNAHECDCKEDPTNPLCEPTADGVGKVQTRAKAYPGQRHLAVLKGIPASQSIVASICAENTTDTSAADYGYRPAVSAIVDRLKNVLQGTCWSQQVEADEQGTVECTVLEAARGNKRVDGSYECPACDPEVARMDPLDAAQQAVQRDHDFIENGMHCVCEIPQASPGEDLDACIGSPDENPKAGEHSVSGWCYIDPEINGGKNEQLVLACPKDKRRMMRFVGDGNPKPDTLTYLQCKGATFRTGPKPSK
jgi:hypothetical protein